MGTTISSPSAADENQTKTKTKKIETKNEEDLIDIITDEEEEKKYRKGRENVINKIRNEKNYNSISTNTPALNKFADCLSLPTVLKNTYLNPNMTLTIALVKIINKN